MAGDISFTFEAPPLAADQMTLNVRACSAA